MRPVVIFAIFASIVVPFGVSTSNPRTSSAAPDALRKSARDFLASVAAEKRAQANPPFDDARRREWQYVPHQPPGITFGEMSDASRVAARRLLSLCLSNGGVRKVEDIMRLESVLFDLESKPDRPAEHRNSGRYGIAIFGDVAGDGPWGMKLEGHHISLNFTFIDGRLVGHTPAFLGANPAEIRTGEGAGRRTLSDEEDAMRDLWAALSDESRRAAKIAETAPPDIVFGPGREILFDKKNGLSADRMSEKEQEKLLALIDVFAQNLKKPTAAEEKERLRAAGFESVRFFLAGDLLPGVGHYARIEGPTLVIEYDNTQNGANHIHTLWRDPERDFGKDPLREHYENAHKK